MACAYPSYNDSVRNLDGSLAAIPCMRCKCCKMELQRTYTDRMYCAWKSHNCSAFVTFTYDDKHLPLKDGCLNPSLSKDDVHKYIDKVRHQIDVPFEYFIAGEYGDKFSRPHYHALFFGLDYQLHERYFIESWKQGSVKVLPCDSKSFRYVTKYISKSTYDNDNKYFDYGIEKPFFKMSRGLGVSQIIKHKDDIARHGYFILDGRKIKLSRYYFNKYVMHDDMTLLNIENERSMTNSTLSFAAARAALPLDTYKRLCVQNKELQLNAATLNKNSNLL